MKLKSKKVISLLLTLCMLLSLLPATAQANNPITVYVTLSMDGEPVSTHNSDKPILYLPVVVTQTGTNVTIDDVFTAVHDQFYTGGAESGYASASGMVTKIWGQSTSFCGYYLNDNMAWSTDDIVSDGSYLAAYKYMDTAGWSDIYAKFNQPSDLKANGNYEFELVDGYMLSGVANAKIYIGTDTENLKDTGKITDSAGKVTLSFAAPGTYHVVAKNPAIYLTPAHCLVSVTQGSSEDERRAIVEGDIAALSIAYTGTDIALPTIGESGKTTITWESNKPDVVTGSGKVIKPVQDQAVALTATVAYGNVSDTKTFELTIAALTSTEIKEQLDAAVAAIGTATLRPQEWNAAFTEIQHTNILDMVRSKYYATAPSVNVSISDPKNQTQIDGSGNIIYGEKAVNNQDVEFMLSLGAENRPITLKVSVPARQKTKQELLDNNANADLLFNLIKSGNSSMNEIKSSLNLQTTSSDYYISISWSSNAESIISKYGSVTRPAFGADDNTVVLTAELSWYGMGGYMNAPGPVPANKTLQLHLNVKAFSEGEYEAAKPEVTAALATITADRIKLMGENTSADLSKITYDLSLPSASGSGFTTTWSADGFDAVSINTYRGNVKRPQIGDQNASGSIKVTVSKAGYSESKEFEVTVLAVTQAEKDAEQQCMDAVKNALVFEVIKGNNAAPYSITENINRVYRGFTDESNNVTWAQSNSGEQGIEISWESSNLTIFTEFAGFNKPAVATPVTLTATLKSIRLSGTVANEKVVFDLIAVPDTSKIGNILEELAGNGRYHGIAYVDDFYEWSIFNLEVYRDFYPGTTYKSTSAARQSYINNVIEALGKSDVSANDLAKGILILKSMGIDASQLYALNPSSGLYNLKVDAAAKLKALDFSENTSYYAAPYILLAGQQGIFHLSEFQAQSLVQLIKDKQGDGLFPDAFGPNPDYTGSVLSALSKYYLDSSDAFGIKTEVTAIIDKSLQALSNAQESSGSFGTANSDAFVLIGLAALGIDADSDSRFIKTNNSLLDGLLAYKNEDGISFRSNDLATEQAFRALIAAAKIKNTELPYNIYDHSLKPSASARATGSGQVQPVPNPTSPQNLTVHFTLTGLDNSDNLQTWLSKSISVPSDATVAYAIIKALENSGLSQMGAESGYIYSVTKPGVRTLSEQQGNWPNSGWLYKVNDQLLDQGITEQVVKANDRILLYYTKDWTKDPEAGKNFGSASSAGEKSTDYQVGAEISRTATPDNTGKAKVTIQDQEIKEALERVIKNLNSAKENRATNRVGQVIIRIAPAKNTISVETEVTVGALKEIAKNTNVLLTLDCGLAAITLDNKTLSELVKGKTSNEKVSFLVTAVDKNTLSEADKAKVGDSPVFDLKLVVGNTEIPSFAGQVEVFLPFTPGQNRDMDNLSIYHINKEGKVVELKDAQYSESRGGFVGTTDSFSLFFIGKILDTSEENTPTEQPVIEITLKDMAFTDVEITNWFYAAVKYVFDHRLMHGVSESKFEPNSPMTRAMLVTVLYRYEGAPEVALMYSDFADVQPESYYEMAIAWAAKNGIVSGYGEGFFGPDDNVTREQLATILYRYAGEPEWTTGQLEFEDAERVSNWAWDALVWATYEGIISGKPGKLLDPQGSATRAETATMLHRFLEK